MHMPAVRFRFYAELNDFLPMNHRQVEYDCAYNGRVSVKNLIEAQGVMHTEVDLILVNGDSVDFTYLLNDGDRVSVYPVFESLDITPLLHLRPQALRVIRFVLDVHLGRLAVYLRMMGFDSLYRNDYDDSELADISSRQHRILLTRDRGLLKRNLVTHGYCVRSPHPRQQLSEVLTRFDLFEQTAPFTRCLRCNGELEPVEKAAVIDQLQPGTGRVFDEFHRCRQCGQVYWRGAHYDHMQALIAGLCRPTS